ncbi:MAG: hypothetical protein JWN40_3367 [Phycisphaerales bacterium]|nr:hypothetical protein [Phycisphaerales bacterium]
MADDSLILYIDAIATRLRLEGAPQQHGDAPVQEDTENVLADLPPQDRRRIVRGIIRGENPKNLIQADIEGGQSYDLWHLLDEFSKAAAAVLASYKIYRAVRKRKLSPKLEDLQDEAEQQGWVGPHATAAFVAILNFPPSTQLLPETEPADDHP